MDRAASNDLKGVHSRARDISRVVSRTFCRRRQIVADVGFSSVFLIMTLLTLTRPQQIPLLLLFQLHLAQRTLAIAFFQLRPMH